jgi:iron(III) transport system ATP-binding protein
MVFQSYALLPHYNIFDNVAYGLKLRKMDKATIKTKVTNILKLVGLEGMEARMTNQLSGGQQQRVALARALVLEPGVLLFDEPLSNLDAKLRVSMRTEIRRIQQEAGITAVYVTHDQSEAMAISDKIIIMEKGIVAQMGSPQEIYYHPKSEFVADFIGEANFLKGPLKSKNGSDGVVDISGTKVDVKEISNFGVGDTCTLVLRPESAVLADSGQLPCRVILSCFMGSYQNYHVMVGDNLVKITDFNPKNKKIYEVGEATNEAIADFIRSGIKEGFVRKDIDIYPAVIMMWSSISGIISMAIDKEEYLKLRFNMSKEDYLKKAFELLLEGVK